MKKRVILFIIALAALLAFQYKLVIPFVRDIASSDLFLEDTGDELNRFSADTLMTDAAYQQCNFYVVNEFFTDQSINFTAKPINAFGLGAYRYIINADIEIMPKDEANYNKRYACRIKYENEGDTTGLSEPDNWSVEGISGLE